ncbi:ferrous iron transport protein A [Streptomyces phyllanthi]|uniref:Ferrous iron transport protein A n=2 Tax=Streptomyces phyllanthi TaxID=1803180 RepID=A0A5N8W1R2_9ACTN|nr:ferrous iron transport protein A [Streptomyces phyllanthi]
MADLPESRTLSAGSRVTVVKDPAWDGPWRNEFGGTIDAVSAPVPVDHPHAYDGELEYWVVFDAPQYDSDGCGPYRKARIWGRYLRSEAAPPLHRGPARHA